MLQYGQMISGEDPFNISWLGMGQLLRFSKVTVSKNILAQALLVEGGISHSLERHPLQFKLTPRSR